MPLIDSFNIFKSKPAIFVSVLLVILLFSGIRLFSDSKRNTSVKERVILFSAIRL